MSRARRTYEVVDRAKHDKILAVADEYGPAAASERFGLSIERIGGIRREREKSKAHTAAERR